MKKVYSTVMMLAMMVAALSFTACGSDDDEVDNGKVEASIVGVWECTYFDFDTDYPEMFDNSGMQIGDRVWCESDGRYSTDYKSGDNETGRWSLKGNILTVRANVEPSFPFDYRITKLTSTELEFNIDLGLLKAFYKFKRVS